MKFIPTDKLTKLREAARNGDELARKILKMQLDGTEDYEESLNGYFAPKAEEPVKEEPVKEEPETVVTGVGEEDNKEEFHKEEDNRLAKYLEDNGITKDSPDYDAAVKDFYNEVGGKPAEEENPFEEIIKKLMKEESSAIDDYSKAITELMNNAEIDEAKKRRAIARFKEIRGDEEEHFRELNSLLKSDEEEL